MKKSLESYTLISFLVVFMGVMAIGGLSLFMVKAMMNKIYLVEAESKNVQVVNQIHGRIQKLIFAMQNFIIHPDEKSSRRTEDLLREVEPKLQRYISYEKAAEYPESREEVRLLEKLDGNLSGIKKIHALAQLGQFKAENISDLELYADNIETLVRQINDLHFDIISRKIKKSNDRMTGIFYLYLFFAGSGFVILCAGFKLHSRHVTEPIKKLAEATKQLAAGDLDGRVQTASRTEIGVLYDSFNAMAAKLQANASKLLGFNQELAEKVRERTRELEEACCSLKQTQDELLRMERLATLGQVATSVNHEIKTPLNSISMNLQLLKSEKDCHCGGCETANGSMEETIRLIDGEILRISGILDEFVRYARFAPPVMQKKDIHDIIRKVADMVSEKMERAGVRIELSLADDLPALLLDEDKLIQALINLCINALQAMPAGGVLTLSTRLEPEEFVLTVADTGTGIAEGDMKMIFQPFFSRKTMGLGFGLPIVQKIIVDHGGRILCRSRVNEGTSFEIRFARS